MLAPDIQAALAILDRGSESVRAVMGAEENRFSRALADLQRLADQEAIPIAVAGGLGAIRYGYPAATQDVAVVVGKNDLDKIVRVAPNYCLKVAWQGKSGWQTLTHGDVEINIVPEGGKARKNAPTTIPGPAALGVAKGLAYATLPGWMELKLSSGRQKDTGHIVEVLKAVDPKELGGLRQRIGQVHASYLSLLDQLIQQAAKEKEQEEDRDAS